MHVPNRIFLVLSLLAVLSTATAAAAGEPSPASCDGTTVDANRTAVTLCGTVTITGTGGDAFDLVVPVDTVINLGACGTSPQDSFLCDLTTEGDSEVKGLVIHEQNPSGDDWTYQVMAERSQALTGGYKEVTIGRGFETVPVGQQSGIVVPAGFYRVRLLGDEQPMALELRTGASGSTDVVPVPRDIDWRAVEPSYGNSTVGGAGESFEVEGPTLGLFAYGWLPDVYLTEVQFGICLYNDPTTVDQTAWAPGCPDQVTGMNDALEFQFGVGFGGPFGQGFAVVYAGDTDTFAWGGYHQSAGVRGTQTAVAFELPLD